MTEKRYLNVVEAIADEDEEQAFDMPCLHENRLGGHGTYCHHPDPDFGGGKCSYRWCDKEWHSECSHFVENPNFDAAKWYWFSKKNA